MTRAICTIVACLWAACSTAQVASNPASREGIWQFTLRTQTYYYSLHEKDGTLVLIDMTGVASVPDPLQSTYVGSTKQEGMIGVYDSFTLNRIRPASSPFTNNTAHIQFLSATEAVLVMPGCDTCSIAALNLEKLF